LRLRFAKRSSTRAAVLIGAVAASAIVALLGVALDLSWLAFVGLGAAIVAAAAFALHLIVTERRRHEVVEEELSAEARFLDSLLESTGRIAALLDADEILQQTCREAERLFGARAEMLEPGASRRPSPGESTIVLPLRVRDEEVAALRLVRRRGFDRFDVVRATVLADFAARASENARLLAEAQVREAERARLSDQLITAEQDERRRLALFLHDGPVQSLSGISLMLDAVSDAVAEGRAEDATQVLASALQRHRDTIRSLRDLSFNIEPVVLRDQGFTPAVQAFAEQVGLANEVQVDLDVAAAEKLAERAQVGLYQIIREAVNQAIRRGPPSRIAIRVAPAADGVIEMTVTDDGAGERRRASFDAIEERARTLNGRFEVGAGEDGGTQVRIVLPTYAAR
jgi:signal transduction histidine kinase